MEKVSDESRRNEETGHVDKIWPFVLKILKKLSRLFLNLTRALRFTAPRNDRKSDNKRTLPRFLPLRRREGERRKGKTPATVIPVATAATKRARNPKKRKERDYARVKIHEFLRVERFRLFWFIQHVPQFLSPTLCLIDCVCVCVYAHRARNTKRSFILFYTDARAIVDVFQVEKTRSCRERRDDASKKKSEEAE